ncbi:MAG: HAD hydrolase family protein [Leptolyngbya sp. SIO1D8]|nr:HAD hydrolase family protein [Leptolyngbya sp. SIO1D8]
MDGTILQGLDFSWSLIWRKLKYSKALQMEGMTRYQSGEFTYEEWCEWACARFIQAGLTRQQLADFSRDITVSNNFISTVETLKKMGLMLAIVSGGIDTLLHDKIPEYEQYFDYVFINRFKFDDAGFLCGVVPTKFDFKHKTTAVEMICKERGYSLEECVFVGDAINDKDVLQSVGLGISYLAKDYEIYHCAKTRIEENDLSLILPEILNPCV